MLAQQVLAEDPFGGALFAFRDKRGQRPTFCIQFSLCDDCLPMAPAGRANTPSIALSPRQGPDVHLYR
jgi:transposase